MIRPPEIVACIVKCVRVMTMTWSGPHNVVIIERDYRTSLCQRI